MEINEAYEKIADLKDNDRTQFMAIELERLADRVAETEELAKSDPDMAELDFSEDISQEFPSVKILKHEEILDLLLLSKIVISVGISSSIFEAQILEKPVISVIVDHDVYGSQKSVSQSCLETKINDFEENFSKLVNDSQSYQQVVQNANNELKENFNNIGQSAKKILDNLKNFENKNS